MRERVCGDRERKRERERYHKHVHVILLKGREGRVKMDGIFIPV